jgi:hypothetical protein
VPHVNLHSLAQLQKEATGSNTEEKSGVMNLPEKGERISNTSRPFHLFVSIVSSKRAAMAGFVLWWSGGIY